MTIDVTAASVDGATVYVLPGETAGETLDAAIRAHPEARHVAVCGDRPGAGRGATGPRGVRRAEAWLADSGRWSPVGEQHVTRSSLRVRMVDGSGRTLQLSRVEPWFGEGVTPGDAAEAMRIVRGVCSEMGTRPIASPGVTGRRMLAQSWERLGYNYPALPADVGALIRETSTQGRFEVLPAAAQPWRDVTYIDARFQYGACAQTELPVGEPDDIAATGAAGSVDVEEYAPAWCMVDFRAPDGLVLGVLGVRDGSRVRYPIAPDLWHRSWCSGAEVQLARRVGYQVKVRRAIVWPDRAKVLAPWAGHIDRERARLESLPIADGARSAARDALRSILVHTVGSLAREPGALSVSFPSGNGTERAPGFDFHRPEWAAAIWSLARVRLARIALAQTAPVLALTLDGFYVATDRPRVEPDSGRSGVFREVGPVLDWSGARTLPDVYGMTVAQ